MFGQLRMREENWWIFKSVKPFDVYLSNIPSQTSSQFPQFIHINPDQVGQSYRSSGPTGYDSLTYERLTAHELGHAAMGTLDSGPLRMENVWRNENPVMQQLGDPNCYRAS